MDKFEKDEQFFDLLADQLEELFPKGKCKERGQALVLNAKANLYHIQLISNRIGQLRQWLNEDRITDPVKMVTNEQLKVWLLPEK